MEDEAVIQIGDDQQWLGIILHNRPYPTSSHVWDRSAITAIIEVNTVEFQGKVLSLLWKHELEELSKILVNLSQRVGHEEHVQFELREHTLDMVFNLDRLGHLKVRVQVSDVDADFPTTLTFLIDADQTYLPKWMRDIRKILEYFPREF